MEDHYFCQPKTPPLYKRLPQLLNLGKRRDRSAPHPSHRGQPCFLLPDIPLIQFEHVGYPVLTPCQCTSFHLHIPFIPPFQLSWHRNPVPLLSVRFFLFLDDSSRSRYVSSIVPSPPPSQCLLPNNDCCEDLAELRELLLESARL
jgi:hypothetical protein